jgi:hypothetical protein
MRKLVLVFTLLLLCLSVFAQKKEQKKEEGYSDLKISVVKDSNGKPVRNAAVVLHQVDKEGRQDSGGVNLKTDMEGKTAWQGIPYGKLRIQVIARGFQTFGDDFDITEPQQNIVIKLKPPAAQFSIYDDNPKSQPPKK